MGMGMSWRPGMGWGVGSSWGPGVGSSVGGGSSSGPGVGSGVGGGSSTGARGGDSGVGALGSGSPKRPAPLLIPPSAFSVPLTSAAAAAPPSQSQDFDASSWTYDSLTRTTCRGRVPNGTKDGNPTYDYIQLQLVPESSEAFQVQKLNRRLRSEFSGVELGKCGSRFTDPALGSEFLYPVKSKPIMTFAQFCENLLQARTDGSVHETWIKAPGGKLLSRKGSVSILMVLAMLQAVFQSVKMREEKQAAPLRDISPSSVILYSDDILFKISDRSFQGREQYLQALHHARKEDFHKIDIHETIRPPEVWKPEFMLDADAKYTPEVMAKGDVYALGQLMALILSPTSRLAADWEKLAHVNDEAVVRARALVADMTQPDVRRRVTAAEAWSRYLEILSFPEKTSAWSRTGEGTYACVGTEGQEGEGGFATKVFNANSNFDYIADELKMAKYVDTLDPEHRFTLKTHKDLVVVPSLLYPNVQSCKKPIPPYTYGMRMESASWCLREMVTMGTGDVVDVLSFAQAQVSLFEGLVIMASKNSVHHDIKPDNVMYVRGFTRNDSKFVFIDFGIAGPEHYEDMRPEPYRYFAPEYNAYVRDTLTTYLENLMGTKASIGVDILQDDGTMTPSMTAETFFALVQRTCVDLKLQPPVHSLPSFDAQGSLLTDCLLQSGSTLVTFQKYVDDCWEAHATRNGFDPTRDHPASVMAQSDMFALGLTLMEVLITAKHLGFIDSRSQGYVRTVWDGLFALYLKMMDFDIAKRPTAEAALHKLNEIIAAGNADVARMKGRRKPTLS